MRLISASLLLMTLLSGPAAADDGYDRLFGTLDQNNDGALSREEFLKNSSHPVNREKAVKLLPGVTDGARLSDMELRGRLFDAMDKNHDGLLSRDEWRKTAPNVIEIRF